MEEVVGAVSTSVVFLILVMLSFVWELGSLFSVSGSQHTTSVSIFTSTERVVSWLKNILETYADKIYPGNNVSKYFLCLMNGCSMLGVTL